MSFRNIQKNSAIQIKKDIRLAFLTGAVIYFGVKPADAEAVFDVEQTRPCIVVLTHRVDAAVALLNRD